MLGTVSDFRAGTAILNFHDFKKWLTANEQRLQERIAAWMPSELSAEDRASLLTEMKDDCINEIDKATQLGTGEEAQRRATMTTTNPRKRRPKKETKSPAISPRQNCFSACYTREFCPATHSRQT